MLQTSYEHVDYSLLEMAIDTVEEIIREVDRETGAAKCRYHIDRLEFLDDKQVRRVLYNCAMY